MLRYLLLILFACLLCSACNTTKKSAVLPTQNTQLTAKTPAWAHNLSIYEVNTRQFSPEGTFAAVEAELPRLQKMGIGIVWFMPITPIGEEGRKGTLGSYYAVKDYRSVNSEYGKLDDFKRLVKKAHSLGMYVIVDWVGNHTAVDNSLAKEHPDWYNKDEKGNFVPPVPDWSDVIDLNYDNKELRQYMIESLKFWVTECDIDGFRADVAEMMPTDFWNQARRELNQAKPMFWLAESEKAEHHTHAFDATYGWEFHHLLKDVVQGQKKVTDIYAYIDKNAINFPPDAYRLYFTTNHDENSWNGTEKEKFGDGAATCFVLCATAPMGMPLVYTGQESKLDRRLKFFDKDPVAWGKYSMQSFYTTLLYLKQHNEALWNGNMGGKMTRIATNNEERTMAFTREKGKDKVLVILNLSGSAEHISLKGSDHKGEYHNAFGGVKKSFKGNDGLTLNPWEYQVWVK